MSEDRYAEVRIWELWGGLRQPGERVDPMADGIVLPFPRKPLDDRLP